MSLRLQLPIYKEKYVGKGFRQKAGYIEIPDNYQNLLEDDVEQGAEIFRPLLAYKTDKKSKTTIVTAPTLEDGHRAISYLASMELSRLPRENLEERPEDLTEQEEYDFDEIAEMDLNDLFDNEDEDETYDDDEFDGAPYEESSFRIPIIPMSGLYTASNSDFGGIGFLGRESTPGYRRTRHWWEACTQKAVCVVAGDTSGVGFGWKPELLSDSDITALRRFHDNEHLYILVIADQIPEEDVSLTKCMLEFTANLYKMEPTSKELQLFYQNVLADIANTYGYQFSEGIDFPLLTEKLSNVDAAHPCRIHEKIMLYLRHKEIHGLILPEHLEHMGLASLINKIDASASAKKMQEELYGMTEVKQSVDNIIHMMKYTALRQKKGIPTSGYHNVHLFVGAPGTAKTTVAKLMAARMQEEGLIHGNRFIAVSGAQLKAPYLGQTSHKIHALFQDYDAILIDEAYSLTSAKNEQDSYAEEALAQLAIELEEHACDKLIIFAGYGGRKVSRKNNRMYTFLEANPGIKSRINSTIYFDSYSSDEMVQLIHHLARMNSLHLTASCDQYIRAYFDIRSKSQDFGNGREARSFLEMLQCVIASRTMQLDEDAITEKMLNKVLAGDVKAAIAKLRVMNEEQAGQDRLMMGF